jgi:hypothetical protein
MTNTFEAVNNVIRVTDTDGSVTFDTGTPMPHIATTINAQVTHSFPKSGTSRTASYARLSGQGCQEYQQVCANRYSCANNYVCNYNYITFQYECGYVYQCGTSYSCEWEWVNTDSYVTYERSIVSALENETVHVLGTLPNDTNPDHLLVLISANRTLSGSQQDYGQFVSAIPTDQTIAANGGTILETTYQTNGEPWLSRIMNVYLSGNQILAQFKHSNRKYTSSTVHSNSSCLGYGNNFSPLDDTRSDWVVNFEIYVGKFTL